MTAAETYYALNPTEPASIATLSTIIEALDGGPENLYVRYNGMLEAGLQLPFRSFLRNSFFKHAKNILHYKNEEGRLYFTDDLSLGHRLQFTEYRAGIDTYAPSMVAGRIKEELQNNAQKRIIEPGNATETDDLKLLLIMLLGHGSIQGTWARRSFARQVNSTQPVDNKLYSWHVTAFSKGPTIRGGEYRIMVTEKDQALHSDIHDDIITISSRELLGTNGEDPNFIFYIADVLSKATSTTRFDRGVSNVYKALFDKMVSVGPAAITDFPF